MHVVFTSDAKTEDHQTLVLVFTVQMKLMIFKPFLKCPLVQQCGSTAVDDTEEMHKDLDKKATIIIGRTNKAGSVLVLFMLTPRKTE